MEYENWMLCDDLNAQTKCFRLVQYRNGQFEGVWHGHVPRHRISESSACSALKALVCRFCAEEGLSAEHILHSYLNRRAGEPQRYDGIEWNVTHPEPGVLRRCCGTNTKAWYDEVIDPTRFQREPN